MMSVVRNQPRAFCRHDIGREWNSGLFDCLDDIPSCWMATLFPPCFLCYLYDSAREACWLPVVGSLIAPLRVKIRTQHHIKGTLFDDYCDTCFCPCLVMCQLKREIDYLKATGVRI
ncbi:unnamed protein product [Trichobilharzia szidati]|nr:unnamed protein product [Trichobilharzia szidati]